MERTTIDLGTYILTLAVMYFLGFFTQAVFSFIKDKKNGDPQFYIKETKTKYE